MNHYSPFMRACFSLLIIVCVVSVDTVAQSPTNPANVSEYLKDSWNGKRTQAVEALLPPLPYPNFLDSFPLEPTSAEVFHMRKLVTHWHQRLRPDFLGLCYTGEAEYLKSSFYQDEDALTSFVVKYVSQYPELAADLLQYAVGIAHLNEQSQAIHRRRLALGEKPEYHEVLSRWREQRATLQQQAKVPEAEGGASGYDLLRMELEIAMLEDSLCSIANRNIQFQSTPQWQDIQMKLLPHQALVSMHRYIVRSEGKWTAQIAYCALVLTSENQYPVLVELPTGDSLQYEFFNRFLTSRFSNNDRQLFDAYWGPIQSQLTGKTEIFFVPDGIYHRLNIKSILQMNAQDNPWEAIKIQRLGNPLALLRRASIVPNIRTVLLLGDPDYEADLRPDPQSRKKRKRNATQQPLPRTASWLALPGTREEVVRCASLLSGKEAKVTTLLGNDANESNLRSMIAGQDVIHLATHAYFTSAGERADWLGNFPPELLIELTQGNTYPVIAGLIPESGKRRPPLSEIDREALYEKMNEVNILDPRQRISADAAGLILAGANRATPPEDGVLTPAEILELELSQTTLVVLSACDSGKADLIDGGNLGDYQAAFQAAGARFLIMSLWPVGDDFTQEFMTGFYGNWLDMDQSLEDAFQQTQLDFKADGYNMADWGGFVLVAL